MKSEAAVSALIARLEDSEAGVRAASVSALGEMKSEAAVPALIARLEDSDVEVRRAASSALGGMKNEAAVSALIARLEDSGAGVRIAAASALGEIKNEAAVSALMDRLVSRDFTVRRTALQSLLKGLDITDRILLSQDLDGLPPSVDPRDLITEVFTQEIAFHLNLGIEEIRTRYEALAVRFHLNLEWRPASQFEWSIVPTAVGQE
jgi:HEAT repeat protein